MHGSASSSSVIVTAKIPAEGTPQMPPTRDPPADRTRCQPSTAQPVQQNRPGIAEDRDRIAQGILTSWSAGSLPRDWISRPRWA